MLSLKVSEFDEVDIPKTHAFLDKLSANQSLQLFFHDFRATPLELKLLERASVVFCGNCELVEKIRPYRPDVVETWCPGTWLEKQEFQETELSVFSFGMAHKIRADHYRNLCKLLTDTGKSYSLYLSTALHEGTAFDDSFTSVFEELRGIFGSRVYFLGYLSDVAAYNYLLKTTYYAAFFEKGVRANNTSVNIAMESGAVVITNLDELSPKSLVHMDSVIDIRQSQKLPVDGPTLGRLSQNAKSKSKALGWDALVEKLAADVSTPTRHAA
jgi:hypothetical protein